MYSSRKPNQTNQTQQTKEKKEYNKNERNRSNNISAYSSFFILLSLSFISETIVKSSFKNSLKENHFAKFYLHHFDDKNGTVFNASTIGSDDLKVLKEMKEVRKIRKSSETLTSLPQQLMKRDSEQQIQKSEIEDEITPQKQTNKERSIQNRRNLKVLSEQAKFFKFICQKYFSCTANLKGVKKNSSNGQQIIHDIIFDNDEEGVIDFQTYIYLNNEAMNEMQEVILFFKKNIQHDKQLYFFEYSKTWKFTEDGVGIEIINSDEKENKVIHCPILCTNLQKLYKNMKRQNIK